MTGTIKGTSVWFENPEILGQTFDGKDLDIKLEKVPIGPISSRTFTTHVVPGQCGDCIYCEGACPNLRFDRERHEMVVNTIGCRGCGICLPACPATALQQRNSYLGRIEKDVLTWLGQPSEGVPVSCNYCPVVVGELPMSNGNRKDIRLICTGRFEAALAIEALGKGYKGLLLVGCFFEGYPFEMDKVAIEGHLNRAKEFMTMLGLSIERLRYIDKYVTDPGVVDCLSQFD